MRITVTERAGVALVCPVCREATGPNDPRCDSCHALWHADCHPACPACTCYADTPEQVAREALEEHEWGAQWEGEGTVARPDLIRLWDGGTVLVMSGAWDEAVARLSSMIRREQEVSDREAGPREALSDLPDDALDRAVEAAGRPWGCSTHRGDGTRHGEAIAQAAVAAGETAELERVLGVDLPADPYKHLGLDEVVGDDVDTPAGPCREVDDGQVTWWTADGEGWDAELQEQVDAWLVDSLLEQELQPAGDEYSRACGGHVGWSYYDSPDDLASEPAVVQLAVAQWHVEEGALDVDEVVLAVADTIRAHCPRGHALRDALAEALRAQREDEEVGS